MGFGFNLESWGEHSSVCNKYSIFWAGIKIIENLFRIQNDFSNPYLLFCLFVFLLGGEKLKKKNNIVQGMAYTVQDSSFIAK